MGRTKKKTSKNTTTTTTPSTPTRRLLSENEYLSQGIDCTQVELNKLRSIMNESSQDGASPWRYIPKLQDPKRFAEFVTGSPHVSRVELSAYEEDLDSVISGGEWEEEEGVRSRNASGGKSGGEKSGKNENSESETSENETEEKGPNYEGSEKNDVNSENRKSNEKRKTPEDMTKETKKINSTTRKIK